MYPQLQVKYTKNNVFFDTIISAIESVKSSQYFSNYLGQSQSVQKGIVADYQSAICDILRVSIPSIKWKLEYRPSKLSRDSIDIFGCNESSVVVIEIDKHRAIQVAKKFVSRMAIFPGTKMYYISLCYPGTARMSKSETIKYFEYCSNLAKRMDHEYAAFIVEKTYN